MPWECCPYSAYGWWVFRCYLGTVAAYLMTRMYKERQESGWSCSISWRNISFHWFYTVFYLNVGYNYIIKERMRFVLDFFKCPKDLNCPKSPIKTKVLDIRKNYKQPNRCIPTSEVFFHNSTKTNGFDNKPSRTSYAKR
jgi:hypothetical protein